MGLEGVQKLSAQLKKYDYIKIQMLFVGKLFINIKGK